MLCVYNQALCTWEELPFISSELSTDSTIGNSSAVHLRTSETLEQPGFTSNQLQKETCNVDLL